MVFKDRQWFFFSENLILYRDTETHQDAHAMNIRRLTISHRVVNYTIIDIDQPTFPKDEGDDNQLRKICFLELKYCYCYIIGI